VIRRPFRLVLVFALACTAATPALAQSPAAISTVDDAVLKPAEPDYTIVSLPTSLRLPLFKSAFRITHRFIRPINCDDSRRCPEGLLEELFGLDNGAYIGLEYRIGIAPNTALGIHRARGDKTIDIFGQYGLTRQAAGVPLELAARFSVEGTNNFRDVYSPTVALVATRLVGDRAALHVEPIWVGNSNLGSDLGDDSTLMVGLGGRLQLTPTVYLVGEFVPRLAGFTPGTHHGSVAIEKRSGGHLFQLTFSNSFATTLGQVARAAENGHDWYLGFNLSRKFF
jgi:hypothetical protein